MAVSGDERDGQTGHASAGAVAALESEGMGRDVLVEALLGQSADAVSVTERASGRFVVVSDSYCTLGVDQFDPVPLPRRVASSCRSPISPIAAGRYEYANDAHCALTGVDHDGLVGHCAGELFSGHLGSARFEVYRQVALTGEPVRTEDVTDGRAWAGTGVASRMMDTMIVAMGDSLVVSARDVTERRAAEMALRASEQRFRAVADSMLESFALFAQCVTAAAKSSISALNTSTTPIARRSGLTATG